MHEGKRRRCLILNGILWTAIFDTLFLRRHCRGRVLGTCFMGNLRRFLISDVTVLEKEQI